MHGDGDCDGVVKAVAKPKNMHDNTNTVAMGENDVVEFGILSCRGSVTRR